MPESAEKCEAKLTEDIGQVWKDRCDHSEYHDQFGFSIYRIKGIYELYHHGKKLGKVNKLHSAKLLSRIWLNDAVLYKKI